eukprot:5538907-Prorocentrum_lima.AAC.1
MTSSLVGSEMCIRDSKHAEAGRWAEGATGRGGGGAMATNRIWARPRAVSYTHLTLPTICSV